MSNRRLLILLLVLGVVVAVLLVVGFRSSGYDDTEREQLIAAWAEVEALAVTPEPAPAGSTTVASFADDLQRFADSRNPADLAAFDAWLRAPGEHRLVARNQTWSDRCEFHLVGALLELHSPVDPDQVAGLLQLTHGLRTEGRSYFAAMEESVASVVVLTVLMENRSVPAGAARWRPAPDQQRRALARRAVSLVRRLEGDPQSVSQPGMPIEQGLLDRLGASTLAWATRSAAVRLLSGERLPAPEEVSMTGMLADMLLGDTEPLERLMASTINPLGPSPFQEGRLAERYDEMLARADVATDDESAQDDASR